MNEVRPWENWNKEIVDKLEAHWNKSMHERRGYYSVLKDLKTKEGMISLLDMGCGICVDLPFVKSLGFTYYGLDSSKDMIERAKQRFPNENIELGDVFKINYPDNQFDIVMNIDILMHIPNYSIALKELFRVTKKVFVLKISYIWEKYPTKVDFDHQKLYNIKYNLNEIISALLSLKPFKLEIVSVEDDERPKSVPEFSRYEIFVLWKEAP